MFGVIFPEAILRETFSAQQVQSQIIKSYPNIETNQFAMQVARLAFMMTILAFTGVTMMTGGQGCCSGVLIGTWKHMHPISLVFDLNMYLSLIFIKNNFIKIHGLIRDPIKYLRMSFFRDDS